MRNYLSEMLCALTSAYSRKDYNNRQMELPIETNIGKLFSILAWGLDTVQEQTEMVKLWDDIDNARGSVLDRYGANFGVKRMSPDDRYYRLAIKVKVMAQLSGGDIDTVIWAASSLMEVEPEEVLLEEVYPAKIALYVDQDILSPEKLEMIFVLADAIKRIMAAGVGLRLYLRTYRTFREEYNISHFCYMNAHSTGYPAIQSRINRIPVQLSQGAVRVSDVRGASPGVELSQSDRREDFRGVYCNVHLKPKRID